MKILKTQTASILSVAASVLLFSACAGAVNTNNSTANTTARSNTAATPNSNQPAVNNAAPVSATPSQADESDASEFQGELQVGKNESVILYVGMESGDYAAYCFANDSEAGRAILAACKNKERCQVRATVEEARCEVPGLEADLSYSARVAKVLSVKSLGSKK